MMITASTNKRHASYAAIHYGGDVTPVTGLMVSVSPFLACSHDGMTVVDKEPTILAVLLGQTTYCCVRAKYVPGDKPTLQWEVLSQAQYDAAPEKEYLIVFTTVTLPKDAVEVTPNNISTEARSSILADDQRFFMVDHRYANSQIRYHILQRLAYLDDTIENLAERTGFSVQHLRSVCLGKSGFSYADIAKLVKALINGSNLLVTMPWVDCGFNYSLEEPCQEDQESEKLLAQLQQEGKVPTTVWP